MPLSKREEQIRQLLDRLVREHKTAKFVSEDPVSIPHRFKHDFKACEMTAFLAALFTYGQRPKIIELLNGLMQAMDQDPVAFIENFDPKKEGKLFQHFVYRFNTADDLVFLLTCLQHAYARYGSLEALFSENYRDGDLRQGIAGFLDTFTGKNYPATHGLKFLFAHPGNGGACKRFNLFLRWVVRTDATDLALWENALKPAELIIPLDTHVLKCNRILGFSKRKTPDWQLAQEITQKLAHLNPEDPTEYDYALMGLGLTLNERKMRGKITLSELLAELDAPLHCALPVAGLHWQQREAAL